MTRTPLRLLVPALLALSGLAAFCPREDRAAQPGSRRPEVDVAALSAQLSEPPGYFDTDNLVSNESSYLQVAEALADAAPRGGVYVGVGPEQNFTYIARVRPDYAFIVDIRRQNLLQHLLFAAIFARADDPYGYLCILFSRPCPPGPPDGWPGAERALDTLPAPSEAAFEANLGAAYAHIGRALGIRLDPADRVHIRHAYRAFFDEQAEIRFHSYGRRGTMHPTYRDLLRARSPGGRFGSFLETEDDYRFVRDLSRRGRIVPVVGGFAGPHALRAMGAWMRARGLLLSAFYASNVEFYLWRDQSFDRFVENLRALPHRPDSVLIRACFGYGRPHPAAQPGHRSVTVLQGLPRFLERHDAGAYNHDWDVCTADAQR